MVDQLNRLNKYEIQIVMLNWLRCDVRLLSDTIMRFFWVQWNQVDAAVVKCCEG